MKIRIKIIDDSIPVIVETDADNLKEFMNILALQRFVYYKGKYYNVGNIIWIEECLDNN